ncbi:MAG: sensor histidine kinase [Suipraeoptans sp.]
MRHIREEKKTFDKKMISFISKTLVVSTLVIIIVATITTSVSITRNSTELAATDAEVYANTIASSFDNMYETVISLTLNNNIQQYAKNDSIDYRYVENIYSALDNVCNMWANINFVHLSIEGKPENLVKGDSIPNWVSNFPNKINQEYEESIDMGRGNMKLKITRTFDINNQYAVSIYCPIYSTSKMDKEIGVLCINLDDPNILQIVDNYNKEGIMKKNQLVHKDGITVVSYDEEKNGSAFDEMELLTGNYDMKINTSGIVFSRSLSSWDFYYVVEIGFWSILSGSLFVVISLLLILMFVLAVVIQNSKNIVTQAYRPWGKVVEAMGEVSDGELSTRLETNDIDPDMEVVSKGFNSMMEDMIHLIDKSKEEQQQMSRIKMEALHSQIQPHFLYNTLDCIRWQAVADGSHDAAQMTKALASYYRICLSRGEDIITLSQEIEYIRNYLYIQKIRYEDILNYEIDLPTNLEKNLIPKLTLQPLVENSIYHGLKLKNSQEGIIKINISEVDDCIKIMVEDNGVGMSAEEMKKINSLIQKYDSQFGYGVRNVNHRLHLYYGIEYGLTYMKNECGGVSVQIIIPAKYDLKGVQDI